MTSPAATQEPADKGVTLVEVLVVVAVIGVLAALAVPALFRARMAANEASAISSLRAIFSAQVTYASLCGRSGYATTLLTLSVPLPGASDALLPPDLSGGATVQKSGFSFTMNAGGSAAGSTDCNGAPTAVGYYASATPISVVTSGSRAFAQGQEGTIFYATGAAAPAPPSAGTPIQ